ncbi:MAG: 30S ribosomal protein S4 [Patescibacteria group bacterium]
MIKAKEKRERFLGESLHLKGDRCLSPKCAALRKPYPPGAHGPNPSRPRKVSDFGRQIREKQKFKVSYGLTDKALRRLFEIAHQDKAPTAHKLLELLERRLDNTIFRLGFAPSRAAARQMVSQGHITINGKNTRTPSVLVEKGDVIGFRQGSKAMARLIKDGKEALEKKDRPTWLSFNTNKITGEVLNAPADLEQRFDVSLLVQSFTK